MIQQIIMDLDNDSVRPFVTLDWFDGCRALIDTGALIPVWNSTKNSLIRLGGKLIERNTEFTGFGGPAEGDLYRVTLKFGDLIYPDMPIVTHRLDKLNCRLILPASMFSGMIYTIDNHHKKFLLDVYDNQPVRNLKVSRDDGSMSVYLNGVYKSIEDYEKSCKGTGSPIDMSYLDRINKAMQIRNKENK